MKRPAPSGNEECRKVRGGIGMIKDHGIVENSALGTTGNNEPNCSSSCT